MKKSKILRTLLTLPCISLLAACDTSGTNNGPQTIACEHTFSDQYSSDETNHWKQATCEHTNLTSDLASHSFGEDNVCSVCGYKKVEVAPSHTHTFSSAYTFDETNHWKASTCEHNVTSGLGGHTYNSSGVCTVCGYKKPTAPVAHTHTFSSAYTYDETNHWKQATCEHTNLTSGLKAHTFNSSNVCTACGFKKETAAPTHEHAFASTYTYDETNHWKAATCEHTNLTSDLKSHTFDSNNKCTTCGYEKESEVVLHTHEFSSAYTYDSLSHWKIATCGHSNLTSEFANHNFGDDNICDTCQYVRPFDPIKVSKIELNKEEYALSVYDEEQVLVTISPNDAENKGISWSSLDENVATVINGKLCGVGVGETYIIATATDGSNVQSFAKVTVTGAICKSIVLNETEKSIKYGETYKIDFEVTPSAISDADICFTSQDNTIAEVDENGTITGVGLGEVEIYISSLSNPSLRKTLELSVTGTPIKSFNLTLDDYQMNVGETYQIKPYFVPANASNKKIAYVSIDESIATVDDNGLVTAVSPGNVTISAITKEEGHLSDHIFISVTEDELHHTELDYTFRDYYDNARYGYDCAPSFKEVNSLVIPVWFTDSSTYIDADHKDTVRNDIEMAHFGSNEETGWRSVSTYFEEASFSNLTFGGMATDWYEAPEASSYYGGTRAKVTALVDEAVAWAKETYPSVDWQSYDADANGFLDCVELIYGVPDYSSSGKSSLTVLSSSIYRTTGRTPNPSDPIMSQYVFSSYDYMYVKGDKAAARTGISTCGKAYSHLNATVDAHYYIHEVGHAFGLDELHNSNSDANPAGQYSMLDLRLGMLDPFSVLGLGWAKAYVPTESMTITLEPYATSGEMIILSPEFHNSPFDEYLVIYYYTPQGLNDVDANVGSYGPVGSGCAIYHIDARLAKAMTLSHMTPDTLTYDPRCTGKDVVEYAFTNNVYKSGGSSSGVLGEDYGFCYRVQYIKNNTTYTYTHSGNMNTASLFKKGATFDMNTYSKQFVNGNKLNSGLDLGWTFTIDNVTNSDMTVTLTKTA